MNLYSEQIQHLNLIMYCVIMYYFLLFQGNLYFSVALYIHHYHILKNKLENAEIQI